MYEVNTAVIGTVVTNPVRRELPSGDAVVSFRMASNPRRFDSHRGEWVDSNTMYLTVSCWRRLVEGVDASLHRGDPVIAYGTLSSHEYRTRAGVERTDIDMRAVAVGPDLARCTALVQRKHFGRVDTEPARSDDVTEHREAVASAIAFVGETSHIDSGDQAISHGEDSEDRRAG
ncbi:single-stranded DNA-binding protein [Nocardia uniformis]|uniref:Single-stranded DNA-binding protein n=1 Tax=Nocardia uniformis TaxID=53432 RepID=A0A849C6K7_9NOCA|nr:single-stranded DNA-binding protein [Nocardia uniformis]NNH74373.1 single-stranded DNA-binding protein [Nocardia uniformis]